MHSDVTAEDLKPVKLAMSGGAPLGVSDEERFLEKVNKPMILVQGILFAVFYIFVPIFTNLLAV